MSRITFACLALMIASTGFAWGQESSKAAPAGKKIVFLSGNKSHGYGAHEHYAGCSLLARKIEEAMPDYRCDIYKYEWPKVESAFDGADCIVMYADGGDGHPAIPRLDQVEALAKKGVGIVCIHYAVEFPKGPVGDKLVTLLGGYFEPHWSVNPHWTAKFEKFPDHPVSRGVKPFHIEDEWYFHMRFREGMKGVTPILSAVPTKDTISRPDGPHSGNPTVRVEVEKGLLQHVAWATERDDGGRSFGFTGGHDHWNWGNENFRKVVLNGIVWCAKGEVPKQGVEVKPVDLAQLKENQDYEQPKDYDWNRAKSRIDGEK
jgi:type 1 glutamine amidotransferase